MITGTKMTGLPSNRAVSTFLSAATMMPSAAAISSAVRAFFTPPEPLVSTFTVMFRALPAFSRASAAM